MIKLKRETFGMVEVDGERFQNIHINDLLIDFGYLYELWQQWKYTKSLLPDSFPGGFLEAFIAFEETEVELLEKERNKWQQERSQFK